MSGPFLEAVWAQAHTQAADMAERSATEEARMMATYTAGLEHGLALAIEAPVVEALLQQMDEGILGGQLAAIEHRHIVVRRYLAAIRKGMS